MLKTNYPLVNHSLFNEGRVAQQQLILKKQVFNQSRLRTSTHLTAHSGHVTPEQCHRQSSSKRKRVFRGIPFRKIYSG